MEPSFAYGNWVRKKRLVILGVCTLGAGALIRVPLGLLYRLVMAVLFVITGISFLLPLYAYVMFSQKGGKVQEKVYNLIIQCLGMFQNRPFQLDTSAEGLAAKLPVLYG